MANFRKKEFKKAEDVAKQWMRICDKADQPLAKAIGPTELDARNLFDIIYPYQQPDEREATYLHFLMRWRSFGYPTFELTHSLASTLLLTDCSGVSGRDFKFPFPSFLITMPCPNSPIASILGREVRQIIIHNMDVVKETVSKDEILNYLKYDTSLSSPKNMEWNRVTLKFIVSKNGLLGGTACPLPNDEETIEDWVVINNDEYESSSTEYDHSHALNAASRLTANLCLYLDALQQDGRQLDKKTSLSKRKSKRESGPALPPAWILGRDIKLSPELHVAAKQVSNPKAKSCTAWQLQSQHIVRGHWKNQAYGPGRTLRKKIRIEPYWKGPRLSEAVLRSFTE